MKYFSKGDFSRSSIYLKFYLEYFQESHQIIQPLASTGAIPGVLKRVSPEILQGSFTWISFSKFTWDTSRISTRDSSRSSIWNFSKCCTQNFQVLPEISAGVTTDCFFFINEKKKASSSWKLHQIYFSRSFSRNVFQSTNQDLCTVTCQIFPKVIPVIPVNSSMHLVEFHQESHLGFLRSIIQNSTNRFSRNFFRSS